MGTKRKLTPQIKALVGECQDGPLLDAFAGMCSVGSEIGPSRAVWSNDYQAFSNLVARALFCSAGWPPLRGKVSNVLFGPFCANYRALAVKYGALLEREACALTSRNVDALRDLFEASLAIEDHCSPAPGAPQDLFTSRYSTTYFSVSQAMEIDSLRYAADVGLASQEFTTDEHRWLLVAISLAMSRCTTSTGHFAQPLAPKSSNVARIANQRARSILEVVMANLDTLRPVGTARWRKKNKVFQSGAISLLDTLADAPETPAVVYADPPYTDDQYSRYYHLYETLILYDYPVCTGRGRYRDGRAVSEFCLPRKVSEALENLIAKTHNLGSDLVLSYPEKGLLPHSKEAITAMIVKHYGRSPKIRRLDHTHSTMGASKGAAASGSVVENLFRVAA
jgi:adenine-specific DNA-methyltransferase